MLPSVAKKTRKIPDYLIYEEIDGKPIYYRGYQSVLNKKNDLEGIMGSSGLQSYIIMTIIEFLLSKIDKQAYKLMTGELGLHIKTGTNLAADIAIYERNSLLLNVPTEKYYHIPPKIVIEVDAKADFGNISEQEYYYLKTQKLLDFGTETVIWFFSKSQKVMISPLGGRHWITSDWSEEVEVLGTSFSLKRLLELEGLDLATLGK